MKNGGKNKTVAVFILFSVCTVGNVCACVWVTACQCTLCMCDVNCIETTDIELYVSKTNFLRDNKVVSGYVCNHGSPMVP